MNLFSKPNNAALGFIYVGTKELLQGSKPRELKPGQTLGRILVSGKFRGASEKKKERRNIRGRS